MQLNYFVVFAYLSICSVVSSQRFRVATYNLANYNDHAAWSQRAHIIADILVKADADVILMQETRFDPDEPSTRSLYQDQAQQILFQMNRRGQYIKAQLVSQPSMYYPVSPVGNTPQYPFPSIPGPRSYWEGSTIISRNRILETGTIFLTKTVGCTDLNLRSTQYIAVSLNDSNSASFHDFIRDEDKFYFYNTHFGLAGQCLIDNVQETVGFMRKTSSSPSLLAGDFNATPDNPALDPIAESNLTDEWTALHPNDSGFTCCSSVTNPTPANRRIDYIWTNSFLSKSAVDIEIIGDEAVGGILGSDHYGLVITFDL